MRALFWSTAACLALSTTVVAQQPVTYQGLEADWYPADGQTALLLMHGTLAHNRMEIIQTIAELVADDHGLPVLAPNLSYNVPGRSGMLDCGITHSHKHSDAVTEIGRWVAYLADQGYQRIVIAGHSRGGAQVSAYLAEVQHPAIIGAVLIAPATFDAKRQADGYGRRFGVDLASLYADASARDPEAIMTVPGFVYCEDAQVTAASFLDYYQDTMRRDTPTNLQSIEIPVTVVAGSLDDVVTDLPERLAQATLGAHVALDVLEGADHFFRDLYADDVASLIAEQAAR